MKKITTLIVSVFLTLGTLHAQNFEWAKISSGGSTSNYAEYQDKSIAIDASGDVYTVGHFEGTVDFDPGDGIFNLTSSGDENAFVLKLDAAGNFVWAKAFKGSSYCRAYAIAVDTEGNVYTTGFFMGITDFDPAIETTKLTSNGGRDIFIHKMDASGNFVWVKSFGSAYDDRGLSLALDPSGNIYTTGYFDDVVDFDPGAGTVNVNSAGKDIFVLKLDPSGNYVWVKSFTGFDTETSTSIVVDALGNVYTTGHFEDTVDFDPSPVNYQLTSLGLSDVFVHKMDADGNFLWAKSFGSPYDDRGYSIAVDASGNVYTTGYFSDTVDFDPGEEVYHLTAAGYEDIFIHKMDASGNFQWVKKIGETGHEESHSISTDVEGNLYVFGDYAGTIDFDPGDETFNLSSVGSFDVFVLKMNVAGHFLWAQSFGGSNQDNSQSIIVDDAGNIYARGYFSGTADFDPSAATYNLTSTSNESVFVQKMSQSTMGIMEQHSDFKILAYPNPASEILYINVPKNKNTVGNISIFDIAGKIIFTAPTKSENIEVNINNWNSGLYFLKYTKGNKQQTVKFVKNQ